MLKSLNLRGAPAFDGAGETTIGPLKPVNFLFGSNGSGKTTISRALADPGQFAGTTLTWNWTTRPLGIKVYNSDYVKATLQLAANLPGVFLLGEESADVRAEIDALTGPVGSIATEQKRFDELDGSLKSKVSEIAKAHEGLKAVAWSNRTKVPAELSKMFVGYNNSQEKLLKRLLEIAAAHPNSIETFDALKAEASAVLDDDATPLAELPLGPRLNLERTPGYELFATPVVGSSDVRLSPLIQQLQNADWVEHGRDYLSQADGRCPFCQQSVPADLETQLDRYFDMRYSQQIAQLKSFQIEVQNWADSWRGYLDDLPTRVSVPGHLDVERLQTARLQLESALERLMKSIELKLAGPSSVITLKPLTSEVGALAALVILANQSIKSFNLRLQNRGSARKAFLDRSWIEFARGLLAKELASFEGEIKALEAGRSGIQARVNAASETLQSNKTRLRELQSKVTSSKPIIEKINQLLDSAGFHSFRLKESTLLDDGYSLERENGDIASDTLSEGERTFITFLYYAQSLQGAPQASDEPNELLAVVDDPISSLDSEVLYTVTTLIRRIVAGIAEGTGRVRQLLVLTHNAHFHKEVTYEGRNKTSGWQFGVIRKRSGTSSEFLLYEKNPIRTAYHSMWEEVRRVSKDSSASAISVQNIVRRILETYFKVLGGVDDSAIIEKFEGEDRIVCQALFSWVNAGSHSIFDALEYSENPSTVDTNLRVFRQIFEAHGQDGHYLMMMGLERTASPDLVVAEAPVVADTPIDQL